MATRILLLLLISNLFIGNASAQLTDTSFTVFNDPSYKIRLTSRKASPSEEETNVLFSLIKTEGSKQSLLLRDSFFCQRTYVKWKDYNNDGIEDLLLFRASSARSNWTYYLYVVDAKTKLLHKIDGFEEIANPEFVSGDNIITSYTLTGKSFYSFYRIDKRNRLIDLHKSFDAELDKSDSIRYDKVIKEIRRVTKEMNR
jgi:hypothetical protein